MSESRRLNFGFGRNHEVEVDIFATRAGIAVEVSSDDMTTWDATWDELVPDSMKVVPVDAIVIERGDLPILPGDTVTRFAASRTADQMREQAYEYLAASEYLTAHPPVDEAQVKAMAPFVHAALEASGGCRDGWDSVDVTRALIRHGVVKPEPTP